MAVRALGRLRAVGSVPFLVKQFTQIDPDLARVANPEFAQNPLSWTDWRLKMYILPTLGELACEPSKTFLLRYVTLREEEAREIAPLQFEEATTALFRQELSQRELTSLLRSPHSGVRGTALLECLDHPTRERTNALIEVAPWALTLPRARR
jgi:hypothetical protein